MNLSAWSIRKPVPAVLCFMLLTMLGLMGFSRLKVQDFPDMDLPTVKISASLEGASPSQLETEVARKIEDKLQSLTLLDHITTTITDGAVSISVSFQLEKDSQAALSEVRNAVDSVRAELPSAMADPSVSKNTSASSSLVTFTVASTVLDEKDLSWFVDNELGKALQVVSGVASVKRIGGIDREIHVDLDPALAAGMRLSPATISSQIDAAQRDRSGGRGDVGGQRQSARTLAGITSAEGLAALSVATGDGRSVRLDQVARISDSAAERSSYAFRDGQPVIAAQITRSLGFSDLAVLDEARNAAASFAATHPQVTLVEATNSATHIRDNYHGSMHLLLEGAILAIVVVWWFLRDWRATLLAATALPLSILPTFGFMHLMGYSLNTVTLLALSLVVGVLVDDAIVEIENIARHLRMGKTPYQAATEAADEIGMAVIATTFTLVGVFLPTAFMTGIPGLVFRQFGIATSVAVLASLLVARMLTPMMAAYWLKATAGAERDGRLMTRYLGWVRIALRRRRLTLAGAGVTLLIAVAVVPLLPTGFVPASDNAQTSVSLELPPGSTLKQTQALSQQAAQILQTLPQVSHVLAAVGSSSSGMGMDGPATADVRKATLTVDLRPRGERRLTQSEVEAAIRSRLRDLPGVRIAVGSGGNGEQLQLTLASSDAGPLESAAAALATQLRGLRGIGNVSSSAAIQQPEVQFKPDDARAAALGVAAEAVADVIRVGTYGEYSSSLPKLNLPERQLAIRVRVDTDGHRSLDDIGRLRVQGSNGSVAVASLGQLALGSGPAEIDRIDRERNVTLSVELNGRSLGEVQREAMQLPALKNLPVGVHLVQQGELQRMNEMFSSFGVAMAIGVFCVYAVLVLLFHDFFQPATILCALPLSLAGALVALLITGKSLALPSVIGILMLMGIVTKNSILLVEYTIVARRDRGMTRLDAALDACHKRVRPIVMTTIAMGAGMLPNALGLGAEPSFRQPMAIVVIGGLIASTLLSLLVIPVIFTYVDDLLIWVRSWFGRSHSSNNAGQETAYGKTTV